MVKRYDDIKKENKMIFYYGNGDEASRKLTSKVLLVLSSILSILPLFQLTGLKWYWLIAITVLSFYVLDLVAYHTGILSLFHSQEKIPVPEKNYFLWTIFWVAGLLFFGINTL